MQLNFEGNVPSSKLQRSPSESIITLLTRYLWLSSFVHRMLAKEAETERVTKRERERERERERDKVRN
jgi:hypothetical protein